jgi:glucokinase
VAWAAAGAANATEVFRRREEPAIAELIARFQRELAFQLVNLVNAVDPERIAVGGGMVGAWDMLEIPLKAALEAHVPYPPELTLGAFPHDAALRGAIGAGVELAARTSSTSTRPHLQHLQHQQGGSVL